jgi:hypothetical protein
LASKERVKADARRDRGMDQSGGTDARHATGNCGACSRSAKAGRDRRTAEPAVIKADTNKRASRNTHRRRHRTMMMMVMVTVLRIG